MPRLPLCLNQRVILLKKTHKARNLKFEPMKQKVTEAPQKQNIKTFPKRNFLDGLGDLQLPLSLIRLASHKPKHSAPALSGAHFIHPARVCARLAGLSTLMGKQQKDSTKKRHIRKCFTPTCDVLLRGLFGSVTHGFVLSPVIKTNVKVAAVFTASTSSPPSPDYKVVLLGNSS